ncbi:MAG: bifunctional nuclease family protein [Myxococcota bacterium]
MRLTMTIAGLTVDAERQGAVLVLESDEGPHLAIAIGMVEAAAIARELQGTRFPRPLTHDLLRDVVRTLSAELEAVEIVDLRDDTYYAELVLRDAAGVEQRLDARPSDAIALAVRLEAPIRVDSKVLARADPEAQEIAAPTDKEGWKRRLREMDPGDFGKYKM